MIDLPIARIRTVWLGEYPVIDHESGDSKNTGQCKTSTPTKACGNKCKARIIPALFLNVICIWLISKILVRKSKWSVFGKGILFHNSINIKYSFCHY